MNHRQIRDALASVFLEVELTVKVKHARSTNSVYLTVSNGHGSLAYVIRIADHRSSVKFSKIDDYWIDASKSNVVQDINAAIQGVARRLGVYIGEVVPEETQVEAEKLDSASEEVVHTPDYSNRFYLDSTHGVINLEQYYRSAHGIVCEIDNNPENTGIIEDDGADPWGALKFVFVLAIILLAAYFIQ
jgi:hypothetical protein